MTIITQAIILAGGRGTRLLPHTLSMPKPMILINNKPFLSYVIENLKENGITEIVLLVGYLHEKIEAYFGDGSKFGVTIIYSYAPVDTDTGSRIYQALPLLHDKFLLLYGDNIWPLRLSELSTTYEKSCMPAIMTVYTNRDSAKASNVATDNQRVTFYGKQSIDHVLSGINIGYFIFKKSVFATSHTTNFSLDEVIANLVASNNLAAFQTDHKYYSLTSVERLPQMERYLSEKKVVFLDRDGVINRKAAKGEYITCWNDFTFLPRVKEALVLLQKKHYEMYIITNQSGIARRMMTKEQLAVLHERLQATLAESGVTMAGIYVCPHGWDEICWCRKPSPGMLYAAASEHGINLYDTPFIGDDIRDEQAGKAAGCKTYLVSPDMDLFAIVEKYL